MDPLRPLADLSLDAPKYWKPAPLPPGKTPLGTLNYLPDDVLLEHVLPRAITKKFLAGFSHTCSTALELSCVLATTIDDAHIARRRHAERGAVFRRGAGAPPLPPAFNEQQLRAAGSFLQSLRNNNPQERAVACASQRDWRGAENAWREATQRWPERETTHSGLGWALYSQGRHSEAGAAYGRALALEPDHAASHRGLGLTYFAQGRHDAAAKSLERALTLRPCDADGYGVAVLVSLSRGAGEVAEAYAHKWLALLPRSSEGYQGLGKALCMQRKWRAAEAAFRRALGCKPGYADAYRGLGQALYHQHRHLEAAQAFTDALALRPTDAVSCFGLGLAYRACGELERAAEALQRTCRLAPYMASAWKERSQLAQVRGEVDAAAWMSAIERCLSGVQANSNDEATIRTLGMLLNQHGHPGAAEPHLRRASRVSANDAVVQFHLGTALLQTGNPVEGTATLRGAIALRPTALGDLHHFAVAQLARQSGVVAEIALALVRELGGPGAAVQSHLGEAFMLQQRYEEALLQFRAAAALDAHSVPALYGLGMVYGQLDRPLEQAAALNRLLEIEPRHPTAWRQYGVALNRLGHSSEAEDCLQQAIELAGYDDLPAAYSALGNLYLGQGRFDEAASAYRAALSYDEGDAEARQVLADAMAHQADGAA